jgi:GNAT superfamily N-acetyltransferase
MNRGEASADDEKPDPSAAIGPAMHEEIGDLISLLYLRPPAFWMRKISAARLRRFLIYAVESRRAVLLLARAPRRNTPAGYVFAIFDPKWFWIGFVFRNPVLALSILLHRLMRLFELRRVLRDRASAGDALAGLPEFSWSPSRPGSARIVGLYVREEHRRKGIAMELYFKLFDALKEKGCSRVEEYMGPDYPQYAGKFPEVCGWQLQQCSSGGYKISKSWIEPQRV